MNKKVLVTSGGIILVMIFVLLALLNRARASTNTPEEGHDIVADPQMLMIPRWFLSSLSLDGQQVDVPAGQQGLTLQFEMGEQANGTGGCNTFSATYLADYDGSLSFGPVVSTRMFCEQSMERENAYFEALSRVQQFRVVEGRLVLTSDDGQTELVFAMPPK